MNERVLIVDNDEDFLETRAEELEARGYTVYRAESLDCARHILETTWVHVAIIDIRMRDNNDSKDSTGLLFAEQPSYQPLPKIILTRYPDYANVRRALGSGDADAPAAADFIAKEEGAAAMCETVERVLERHVRANWKLKIIWGDLLSLHQMLTLIVPDSEHAYLIERGAELQDLLRKLFYDYGQITIGRLLCRSTGKIDIEVFAYREAGAEAQFVVSCGMRQQLEKEDARYDQHAPKSVGTGSTSKDKCVETVHFAAIAYKLIGGALEEMLSFRDFYHRRFATDVTLALEHLFMETVNLWHRGGRLEDKPLAALQDDWKAVLGIELDRPELERRVEAICHEMLVVDLAALDYGADRLIFHLPGGAPVSFANPMGLYEEQSFGAMSLLYGIMPGRIDPEHVLVDRAAHTWLIDFSQAGSGPLTRNFTDLELAIKLDLLDVLDVHARYVLEKRLLNPGSLAAPVQLEGLDPEVERALHTAAHIRYLAAMLVNQDLKAYLLELLFGALRRVADYDPELHYTRRQIIPFAHALLLAAMVYDKLIEAAPRIASPPEQAHKSLWIDETNKQVWVEGQQIELTPQEFKILYFLYLRPNQLCLRHQLAKGALESSKPLAGARDATGDQRADTEDVLGDGLDESRLNSALSRLRQKIEPDPEHPIYLQTVRGHGYRLVIS